MTTTSPSNREHSEISPSSMQYRSICHYWTPETTKAAYVEEAAARGERLHDAIPPSGTLDGLTEAERTAVKWCRGVIQKETDDSWNLRFEQKVATPGDQWGYVDCIATSPHKNIVKIFDFKMGREPVAWAKDNLQLQAYAVGVADTNSSATTIATHILQPWRENDPDHHDMHVYTRPGIETLRSRCAAIVENAKNPTVYQAGAHCSRCQARSLCPTLGATAIIIADNYQDKVSRLTKEDFHASKVKDPEKAGILMDLAAVMSAWADSVKYHMTQLAVAEEILPDGWAMAHRKGASKTLHPEKIWGAVNAMYGVNTEKFLSTVDVNYTKLKQVVRECIPHGKKKDVDEALEQLLVAKDCLVRMNEVTYLRKKPTSKTPKKLSV